MYFCDNCDNAGFYEIDIPIMEIETGIKGEALLGAIKGLNRGYLGAGETIWLKSFLRHQKNLPLNPNNNAHKQIISIIQMMLKKFPTVPGELGADKGLFRGPGKGKGKDNYKYTVSLEYTDSFISFWEAYPNKTGKGAAYKSWEKMKPPLEKVMAALEWQKKTAQWTKDDGAYIPHPSTWLNQSRWEDESPKPAKSAELPYNPMNPR